MSSGPLDVALRVRWLYEAGGAKQATGDLDQVATKAQKLGGLTADRLGRDLREVGGAAQGASRALTDTATQAAKLGSAGAERLETGLKRVEAPARDVTRRLEDVGRAAARFGSVSTVSYLARDLQAVAAPADRARRELAAIGDAASRLGRSDGVRTMSRELAEANREAASLHRRIDGLHRQYGSAGIGGSVRAGRHDFGNEALMASGLGGGLRFGMSGAAAGGLAAGAGIAGTAAIAAKATREAISFEAAMSDVRKAVDDLSPEQFAALERKILQVSAATGIAKEKLAELTAEAGFSGVPKEDLARFAEFGAKAASAFRMPEGETGDKLAKLRTNFSLTQDGVEDLADSINVLADTSSARESQIIDFLERTSGGAKMLGAAPRNIAAIGAAIISVGPSAQIAGTGINALMTKLGMATSQNKEFKEGLRTLGLSARQVKADMIVSPEKTLIDIFERINNLPKEKKLDVTGKLGGLEYVDDLSIATGQVEQMRAALARMQDQAGRSGSVEKAFKIFDATTSRNLARAGAAAEGFATRIGKTFTPAVNAAAGAVERWFGGMNKAMDRRAEAEALAGRMAKGEKLSPKDQARVDADPRLKDETDKALVFERRRQELEANRRKAQTDPGALPSMDAFRQQREEQFQQMEERRKRVLSPPAAPPTSPDATPLPGTGKRSDLSDGAKVSLAAYHDTVERSLDRTERMVRDASRRMRDELAIGAKVELASLLRSDPAQQIRIERASLGGGSLGSGGAGRGYGGGSGGLGSAPGRFGGLIPPRAGERHQGGPAGDGAHEKFGGGGGTRGAARTGEMMSYAMDQLRREGVPEGQLREAAAHLVGQAHMESGLDPNKSHDGGTGFGIYGARDPSPGRGRRTDMFRWLEKNGYARNSAEGQMRYMAHEAMSGRYKQTRGILMGGGSGDLERDTNTITREFESPKIVNRRSGAVRNALRVGPEDSPTDRREGAGAPQAGENGKFDPLGGAARRYSSGYGMREHPVHGGRRMHHGQDMAAPGGTGVHSMEAGEVTQINRHGDVTVRHADGSTKTYRHITPGGIRQGQRVEAGAPIGRLRHRDPRSTGPHLHMEATDAQGRRYDPRGEIEASQRAQAERQMARPPAAQPRRELPTEGAPGTRSPRFTEPRMQEARARPAGEAMGGVASGRASGGGGGPVTQNFYGGFDEQAVARRAQLERNRAVRNAFAGALGDVGRPG